MGIAKASKNQETAKRFLSFLLRKQNEQLVAANELPVRSDVTLAPSLTALASDISSGDINTILTPTRLGGYLTGVLYPLESDLLFGKTTAAKFISDLKSKSAQYWSSKK